MPQRCINDDLRRNKPLDTFLTSEEEPRLRAAAKAADTRFTTFVRETVLAADLADEPAITRRRCSPGRCAGVRRQVYFTFAERELIRSRATLAGMTVSDYLYRCLVRVIEPPTEPAAKRPKAALAAAVNTPAPIPQNRIAQIEAAQLELVMKLDRLNQEVNAIGVNLNQLAHKANAGRVLPNMIEQALLDQRAVLEKASTTLEEVARAHVPHSA